LPPLNVKATDGCGNAAKVRPTVVEVPDFIVKVSLNVESGVRTGATTFTHISYIAFSIYSRQLISVSVLRTYDKESGTQKLAVVYKGIYRWLSGVVVRTSD